MKIIKKREEQNEKSVKNAMKEIESMAYDLYQERRTTGVKGDDMTDWLKAERRVQDKTFRY